jgi:aminoglycoside/choline kinase family phosphotransferase
MRWLDDAAKQAAAWRDLPIDRVTAVNPPLDHALLRRELAQTWELFLRPALTRERGLRSSLEGFLEQQVRALSVGPQEVCHRDLMARNLVVRPGRKVAIVDHQDLRVGPAGYDLASLWNDSLYPPKAALELVVRRHLHVDREQLARCVVQRSFKIVGTFVRFARLGSPRYLGLVRPTLRRALNVLPQLGFAREDAARLRRPLTEAAARLC